MPLPARDRSDWAFDVNIALPTLGSNTADCRRLLRLIKSKLVGTGAWYVRRSCNGSSIANADLWTSDSAVRWGLNTYEVHSWAIIKHTTYAFEFLLDPGAGRWNEPYYIGVYASSAGFTGGTTVTSPTATDSYQFAYRDPVWHGMGSGTFNCALHFIFTTDGAVQRLFIFYANSVVFYLAFEAIREDVGLEIPRFMSWYTGSPNYGAYNDAARFITYQTMAGGKAPMAAYLGCEGYVDGAVGQKQTIINELSGEYPLCPISVCSETAGVMGHHGYLYDCYFGCVTPADGDSYPADGSAQLLQIGDIVVPWYGGTVLMA